MPGPSIGAITVFVADVPAAKAWYQRAFQVALVFEDEQSAALQFGNTIINLLLRSEAAELVGPARVAEPGAGATAQLTIWSEDLAADLATLSERGVPLLNGPVDRPWGVRTACIQDPDGTVWEFAQNLQ